MSDINTIAKQFVDFYYQTFDSNRASLSALYVRSSPVIYRIPSVLTNCIPSYSVPSQCSPGRELPFKVYLLSWRSSLYVQALVAASTKTLINFQSLPFEKVVHKVTTQDAQPSSPSVPSLLVSVTGLLLVIIGCTAEDGYS